jgi:8-oxo-dGTP diphosphatase
MIEVCCAILVEEKKILAVQRGPVSAHPWQWEFPGGKIHPGETAEQCIVREIEEELCIRVEILFRIEAIDFDYGEKQIKLIPFVCQRISGGIYLTEHIAKEWINLDNWEVLNWPGADFELIRRNQYRLQSIIYGNDQ